MQLYSTVAYQGELNEQANFRSFGNAMLLLLRFSTGESWMSVMYALLEDRKDCCQDIWCCHGEDGLCDLNLEHNQTQKLCIKEENCIEINGCSAGISVFVYFYSFIIIVSFIILNMIVALVLEAFEASSEGDILEASDLEEFVQVWSEFDPNATWFINATDVQRLVAKLSPPLGVFADGGPCMKDECVLSIPVNNAGQVNIVSVASLLAKRATKEVQGDDFGELSDDHPLKSKLAKTMLAEGATTLGDVYLRNAGVILRAVRRFRQKQIGSSQGRRKQSLVPSGCLGLRENDLTNSVGLANF